MCNSATATEGVDAGTKLGEWTVYYAMVKVHVVLGGGCVISKQEGFATLIWFLHPPSG